MITDKTNICVDTIVLCNDGSHFRITYIDNGPYFYLGECIKISEDVDPVFEIDEECTWTKSGQYNSRRAGGDWDIERVISREETPEYFL